MERMGESEREGKRRGRCERGRVGSDGRGRKKEESGRGRKMRGKRERERRRVEKR